VEPTDRRELLSSVANLYRNELNDALTEDQQCDLFARYQSACEEILKSSGEMYFKGLEDNAPAMLEDHKQIRSEFEIALLDRWGVALDLLYTVYVISEEMGKEFNLAQRPSAAEDRDFVFEALVGIHARACLTTSEVMALLRTGHSTGALARWRTLHECAVIASVIGEYGRIERIEDLAERYLLHDVVQNERDAREYQAHSAALGVEPFDDTDMAQMANDVANLVKRFGKSYKKEYGWALPLFPQRTRVTFRDLEELACLNHIRPYYGLANHGVHADSKGARLNKLTLQNENVLLVGPSDLDLADAGQCAAISINQVTASLIINGRPHLSDISDVPELEALGLFVRLACEAFFQADASLDISSPSDLESDPESVD
jgi:hypothetical protein